MSERYAEVAVLSGSPQRAVFTYAIRPDMALRRGMSVIVPWRSQWAIGIVLAVTAESEVAGPRLIERVLDRRPLLTSDQLDLAVWISDRYLAPVASCVQLFLPPGTPSRPRRSAGSFRPLVPARPAIPKRLVLSITEERLRRVVADWPQSKRSRPGDLLAALCDREEGLVADEAARLLGGRKALDSWLAGSALAVRDGDSIVLAIDQEDARAIAASLRRTGSERRQLELLRLLTDGPLDEVTARRRSAATRADIDTLEHAGYLVRQDDAPVPGSVAPTPSPELTGEQQSAVDEIIQSLESDDGSALLLHGVTGSGKTEVYLAAAERALASGGGVIVLVPEIALAPQTIARFDARFPGQVAVRHSGLARAEAREQWRQVYAGEKRILVGARSALFGPVKNLALVIIDEEHEWTYKQTDPQPRYHAVTIAREMAHERRLVTLLGSATPSVVSMAEARAGRSSLLRLTQRVQSGADGPRVIPQPIIDVVDLREELAAGVRSVFGRELDAAISEALSRDEQVLLFLNRRGMSALVCRACGEAIGCSRCSIALTLHRPGPYLQCHECGERQPAPARCPLCLDERIGAMSFGTAQLEAEVRRRWGDVPITRWDRDTASSADSHEALLAEFADRRSRVLIGTQMIAKGLDLPSVTVAGVVNADLSLRESDYLAAERTFQLLSQVAGRSGRGALGGRVIIQTYSPDHFAVVAAAAHDYDAFYTAETHLRRMLDYPPFGRMARITVTRSSIAEADAEAERMVHELSSLRDRTPGSVARILGPAPASPARRRNQWRRQALLIGDDPLTLLRQVELGRGWSVDVDPLD
ncbi:MAG: primosomal protein N' [Chloroflexi bacterium]|nr:primosomal protein N' [Chloroflexota bacterium]